MTQNNALLVKAAQKLLQEDYLHQFLDDKLYDLDEYDCIELYIRTSDYELLDEISSQLYKKDTYIPIFTLSNESYMEDLSKTYEASELKPVRVEDRFVDIYEHELIQHLVVAGYVKQIKNKLENIMFG